MLRLTTVLLALVHVLGASAYAEDEMAMMAQEARLRILSRLEAKKIPEGIANAVARLTDNDSPTREGAAKALLENPDRANVITALIAAIHEDNNNKQPNCGTVLVKLGADVVPALIAAHHVGAGPARRTRCGGYSRVGATGQISGRHCGQ